MSASAVLHASNATRDDTVDDGPASASAAKGVDEIGGDRPRPRPGPGPGPGDENVKTTKRPGRLPFSRPALDPERPSSLVVSVPKDGRPFAKWTDAEKAAWLAKKKAKEAEKERLAAIRRKAPKQTSLRAGFEAAEARLDPSPGARVADALPIPLVQRVLELLPPTLMWDARAVCKTWRDAADDPAFARFAKAARVLASAPRGAAARASVDLFFRLRGVTDAGGAVAYVANGAVLEGVAGDAGVIDPRPFRSPLKSASLVAALPGATARARRLGREPGAGLTETTSALARWALTGGDGWATLAAAVFGAAEDAAAIAALLDAAETAAKKDAAEAAAAGGGDCYRGSPEAELAAFVAFLTAAMASEAWRAGDAPSTRLKLAHLEAAAGYHELSRTRLRRGSRSLTHEQLAVVSAEVPRGRVLLVRAFAGTGKTTTLLEYVKRRPGTSFAYLTFNRQVMLEAKARFPRNTAALSFHGLAYKARGFAYREKAHRGALRPRHARDALGLAADDERAALAIRTLDAFLKSADDDVTDAHVPPNRVVAKVYDAKKTRDRLLKERRDSEAGFGGGEGSDPLVSPASDLVALAKRLWESMKRLPSNTLAEPERETQMPMTDAGYMKLYQLSRPRLDLEYDVLLLDEAQDCAPVMADVVTRQSGCGKILVGDPHQEIYSFMGAKNAMEAVAASVDASLVTERRLSRSFRFGPEIAAVANSILRLAGEDACVLGARPPESERPSSSPVSGEAKEEEEKALLSPDDDRAFSEAFAASLEDDEAAPVRRWFDPREVFRAHAPSRGPPRRASPRGSLAILCRGNAAMFAAALSILGDPEYGRVARVGFVGGAEALRLDQLVDIWRLSTGREEALEEIRDAYVRGFARVELATLRAPGGGASSRGRRDPLAGLKRQSELVDDQEMMTRVSVVERVRNDLPELVERIREQDVGAKNLQSADFILSTAHKAKGLEFENVLLWNDFAALHAVAKRASFRSRDEDDADVSPDAPASASASASASPSITVEESFQQTRPGDPYDPYAAVEKDEINLVYVAATRAMRRLYAYDALATLHEGRAKIGVGAAGPRAPAAGGAAAGPPRPCRNRTPADVQIRPNTQRFVDGDDGDDAETETFLARDEAASSLEFTSGGPASSVAIRVARLADRRGFLDALADHVPPQHRGDRGDDDDDDDGRRAAIGGVAACAGCGSSDFGGGAISASSDDSSRDALCLVAGREAATGPAAAASGFDLAVTGQWWGHAGRRVDSAAHAARAEALAEAVRAEAEARGHAASRARGGGGWAAAVCAECVERDARANATTRWAGRECVAEVCSARDVIDLIRAEKRAKAGKAL